MSKITAYSPDTTPSLDDLIVTVDIGNGNKKVTLQDLADAITPSIGTTLQSNGGWVEETELPDTITNNGNRSYDLVFNSTDLTDTVSQGMRLRLTRTVSAPTYMGGLFNGSSHYFTKTTCTSTLSTVTNNFTLMCWAEPTVYQQGFLGGRADSTPANGLGMRMESDGRVSVVIWSGGAGNYRTVSTYQSLPLNKKTTIAASWTSGTVVIYFDGVSVPVATAVTGGTAPTTAGTGGDFSIGRFGAYNAQYFAGYISGFGAFDAVLTAATIRSYSSQVLSGSETNCIGAWSLNNTGVNQQAAGTNDLTATGGVSYTVRSPYGNYLGGTLDYAIITKTAFSTNTTLTVQVPEGCAIPTSGGLDAVYFSGDSTPYKFPKNEDRWRIEAISNNSTTTGNLTITQWLAITGNVLTIPVGEMKYGYRGFAQENAGGAASSFGHVQMASSLPGNADYKGKTQAGTYDPNAQFQGGHLNGEDMVVLSVATAFNMYGTYSQGTATVTMLMRGDLEPTILWALPAGL